MKEPYAPTINLPWELVLEILAQMVSPTWTLALCKVFGEIRLSASNCGILEKLAPFSKLLARKVEALPNSESHILLLQPLLLQLVLRPPLDLLLPALLHLLSTFLQLLTLMWEEELLLDKILELMALYLSNRLLEAPNGIGNNSDFEISLTFLVIRLSSSTWILWPSQSKLRNS